MTTHRYPARIRHSGIAAARRAARANDSDLRANAPIHSATPGRSLCAIAVGQVIADGQWSIGATTLGEPKVTCRKLVAR
jgi:hypothetical protein